MKVIQEIGSSRPWNWQRFCCQSATLELLLLLCLRVPEGLADIVISLLTAAIKPLSKKSEIESLTKGIPQYSFNRAETPKCVFTCCKILQPTMN